MIAVFVVLLKDLDRLGGSKVLKELEEILHTHGFQAFVKYVFVCLRISDCAILL